MPESSQDAFDRIDQDRERYLAELKDYLRIPSISTDPAYREEVRRCAAFLRDRMEAAGLAAEVLETSRHPLVYGEWTGAAGRPTVLFYGHYDVQPADPLEEWRNPPFEPTEEGHDLVARGATDDKGQSFAHLKAVEALMTVRGELPVNVKFLIEGEEESGGDSIEEYVRADGGRKLAADVVMISDSSFYAPGLPALLYGLRGLAYMEVAVRGPNRDLHSGSFGGTVANPANALADILARLVDPASGRILIPGFYDDVRPLEDWEREEFAKLPFDEAAYAGEIGVSQLRGESGYTPLERVWGRPSCDVNGIFGGYMGEGAKTILPARAGAKVSMRLVPDQDPQKIGTAFRRFVAESAPPGVEVEVTAVHGAAPVVVDTSGPLAEAALDAMEEVWGRRPVRVREGGSIPIVSTFARELGAPVLLLGFGLPDDRLHAPNEKIDVRQFHGGIRATARILDRMGERGAGG